MQAACAISTHTIRIYVCTTITKHLHPILYICTYKHTIFVFTIAINAYGIVDSDLLKHFHDLN